jgi:hypothetical protein
MAAVRVAGAPSTQISRAASLLVPAPRIRPPITAVFTATYTPRIHRHLYHCITLLPSTRHGLLELRCVSAPQEKKVLEENP